jgi:hypothetical protein
MDQIRAMLNRLPELSDDELSTLEGQILSEFETVEKNDPTQETIATMSELADAIDAVRGETTGRTQAAAALVKTHEELASRVRGAQDVPPSTDAAPADAPTDAPVDTGIPPVDDDSMGPDAQDAVPAAPADAPVPDAVPADAPPADGDGADAETPADVVDDENQKKAPAFSADESIETADEVVTASAEDAEVADEAPAEADAPEAIEASAEVVDEAPAAEAETETAPDGEGVTASVEDTDNTSSSDPEDTVTASVNGDNLDAQASGEVQPPADRRPRARAATTAVPVSITAGADIPGISAGSPFENMAQVSEAMVNRMHTMRRVQGGDGEQHTVATLVASFPEGRHLRANDLEGNSAKVESVLAPQAITAAGGIAAPLEVRYDLFGFGVADRPVKDALSPFTADRGGIRYITPPVLTDLSGAVALWTVQDDIDAATAGAPDPVKPCLRVAAGSAVDVTLDAITLCLTFGNMGSRAYPELVARQNELGLIQHARFAETRLLTRVGALSTAVTAAKVLGAARDWLVQVDKAAAAYRNRHRLNADFPLRVIAPAWAKNLLRADLTMQMPGDGQDVTFNLADSTIEGYLSTRNISATWTMDGVSGQIIGAQSAGALVDFPHTLVWYLFAEGTFLFLDGGTLDLGLVRDSTLNGTNDYQMFVETFEAVAKVGIESLAITSTIAENGNASALVDTTAIA